MAGHHQLDRRRRAVDDGEHQRGRSEVAEVAEQTVELPTASTGPRPSSRCERNANRSWPIPRING